MAMGPSSSRDHGRRLAGLLPDARLVEIEDSYTLIMRDQPEAFARAASATSSPGRPPDTRYDGSLARALRRLLGSRPQNDKEGV
jgi:hypothetical protein